MGDFQYVEGLTDVPLQDGTNPEDKYFTHLIKGLETLAGKVEGPAYQGYDELRQWGYKMLQDVADELKTMDRKEGINNSGFYDLLESEFSNVVQTFANEGNDEATLQFVSQALVVFLDAAIFSFDSLVAAQNEEKDLLNDYIARSYSPNHAENITEMAAQKVTGALLYSALAADSSDMPPDLRSAFRMRANEASSTLNTYLRAETGIEETQMLLAKQQLLTEAANAYGMPLAQSLTPDQN